ncbi:M28 family peptidase [Undibacterium sp. Ji50W]|uniref:M28 family peptidase n=1 Tax=Undibacterium sp. Ji50W TaxID=3413041 RepID=UPI003BF39C51
MLTAVSLIVLHLALSSHAAQAQQVQEAPLRAHLAFLSDDLLEGRGTGQRGGDLAVRYLETQAAAMGLVQLPGANGYRQTVTLVGSQTLSSSQLRFETNKATLSPVMGADIVYGSSNGKTDNDIDAPLVFVGYGVRAPEERWDDFKGVDLKGKLLVMMVNDPQPTMDEPNRFGGKALTYYGRWTYKFEEAARQGAAGVLLIHTLPSASYAWNVPQTSFSHERFSLGKDGNALEGWIQEDTAKALFAAAGQDLDALRAHAETREFKPVALDARIHLTLRSAVRKVEQQNVIGMVPGNDAKLKDQAVVYSAHWDHLGFVEEPGKPAQIWNGAVDNASGAAALLAMAQAAVTHPAKRTQIFLWPCAEEQSLLGSAFYVQHPLWPLEKTAADLNLDSMNFVGKTQDMGVAGSEHSSLLNSAAAVAKKMGLRIAPSVPDLGGAFFRADHFNFVRAGVPAFNVGSAVFSGDGSFAFDHDAEQEAAQMKAFKKDYHTPRDRYNPAWDLSGMVQQAQFTLNLGYALGNDATMPVWKKDAMYRRVAK